MFSFKTLCEKFSSWRFSAWGHSPISLRSPAACREQSSQGKPFSPDGDPHQVLKMTQKNKNWFNPLGSPKTKVYLCVKNRSIEYLLASLVLKNTNVVDVLMKIMKLLLLTDLHLICQALEKKPKGCLQVADSIKIWLREKPQKSCFLQGKTKRSMSDLFSGRWEGSLWSSATRRDRVFPWHFSQDIDIRAKTQVSLVWSVC